MASLVAQEQLEPCRVQLTIEVGTEDLTKASEVVMHRAARQTTVPGFRPGKAPLHLVKKFVDQSRIAQLALDEALNAAFRLALKESGISPYTEGEPKIDLPESAEEMEGGFQFKATIPTQPDVTLGDLEGLTARRVVTTVTDEEVEKEIAGYAERGATYQAKDGPAEVDDRIRATVVSVVDGEVDDQISFDRPTLIQVGANLAGFDEGLVGLTADEEKTFEFTYPDDFEDEGRRGKTATVRVKTSEVLHRVVPTIDDEFAVRVGTENLEALRERVRDMLQHQADRLTESEVNDALLSEVVSRATVHVPSEMIDKEATGRLSNLIADLEARNYTLDDYLTANELVLADLQERVRAEAESGVRTTLVLLAVARENDLLLTDRDIEDEIKRQAELQGVKSGQIRKALQQEDGMTRLQNELFFRKLTAFLREQAEIIDIQG